MSDQWLLFDEEIQTYFRSLAKLCSLLRIKVSQLYQRPKSKCLKEGSSNYDFFHALVKSRSMSRRNVVLDLKFGDVWLE